jgi:hypothetical protein
LLAVDQDDVAGTDRRAQRTHVVRQHVLVVAVRLRQQTTDRFVQLPA